MLKLIMRHHRDPVCLSQQFARETRARKHSDKFVKPCPDVLYTHAADLRVPYSVNASLQA